MTTIHAFKRPKATSHEIGGVVYKFVPNEHGHVVCDVQEPAAVERFLSITTAFRRYRDDEPEAPSPLLAGTPLEPGSTSEPVPTRDVAPPPAEPNPRYVLVNGDAKLDLNSMDDDALRAFAKENGIKVHHNAKRETILETIVKAFEAPAGGQG